MTMPEAAPAVWMDQRGNYWRVFADGSLSIPQTTTDNYGSEPLAVYRQGRDLSAQQMQELLAKIEAATDDPVLRRAANSAWYAWVAGRDMVTEAELLMQGLAIRQGVNCHDNVHDAHDACPGVEHAPALEV